MMRFNTLTAELSGAPIFYGDGIVNRARASLARGYRRLVKARQESAQLQVYAYLSRHSDVALGELGFSADEIKAVRRQTGREPRLWY